MEVNVLNLGAGVQSSTVYLMACLGEIPKPDYAIFADTGYEPSEVYEHLQWLMWVGEKAGIKTIIVSAGNIKTDTLAAWVDLGKRCATMPLFLLSDKGKRGILRRQCTVEYKVQPITNYIKREILKVRRCAHVKKDQKVRQWYGISADEIYRVKTSPVYWTENVYPLLNIGGEFVKKEMTRQDCVSWLNLHFPERTVPRSACLVCPYHSDKMWLTLKESKHWEDIVAFDKAIRKGSWVKAECYLHEDRKPIDQVQFNPESKKNPLAGDCMGLCGV